MSSTRNLSTLPPLREVIALHNLSARKSLGQNFLLDLNIPRRIVQAAGPLEEKPAIVTRVANRNRAMALGAQRHVGLGEGPCGVVADGVDAR